VTRAPRRVVRRRAAAPASIHLRIETLALLGFPSGGRAQRIGAAARRELTRLIAERGVPAYMKGAPDGASIDAGSFRASPGTHPADLGARIAGAIHRGPAR
jgi:hypothetical protein